MGAVNTAALTVSSEVIKAVMQLWLGRKEGPRLDIADAVSQQVPDALDRRRVLRQLDHAADTIAARLAQDTEASLGLTEDEQAAAMTAVAESFARATLTEEDLFAAHMDPVAVAEIVRRRFGDIPRSHLLSEAGQNFYDSLLRETSAVLVSVLTSFPSFQAQALTLLVQREGALAEAVEAALFHLPGQTLRVDPEIAYRATVADALDQVELFGFDVSTYVQRHRLTDTFAKPTVQIQRTPVPLDWAVRDNPMLFLHGPAGSGKTSILKWLAVSCARQTNSGLLAPLNDLLPLYVRAHDLTEDLHAFPRTPALARLASPAATARAAEAAIGRRAEEGTLLILIDGLDETPQELRRNAQRWLGHIIRSYPQCRYVLTSRNGHWTKLLESHSFATGRVRPLDRSATTQLVRQWFSVLRTEAPAADTNRLLDVIDGDNRLRDIAATPLMCTLTCLLFQEQGELAFRGIEIYRAFIEMFVERRDIQREVGGSRSLPRHEMLLLLGMLALHMVQDGVTELSSAKAIEYIDRERMSLPRVSLAPEETYEYLIQRSGVLIEPAPDRLQFVHRTFMEYLCAESFLEHHDIGELVSYAHKPTWRAIVPMTAALSHGRQADEIIRKLLTRYGNEPLRRTVLDTVIQACVAGVSRLDPEIRHEVEHVRRMFPPISKDAQEFTVRADDEQALTGLREWLCTDMFGPLSRPVLVTDIRQDGAFSLTSTSSLAIGEIVQSIIRWRKLHGPWAHSRIVVEGQDGTTVTVNAPDNTDTADDR
jgi:NACHT domain